MRMNHCHFIIGDSFEGLNLQTCSLIAWIDADVPLCIEDCWIIYKALNLNIGYILTLEGIRD